MGVIFVISSSCERGLSEDVEFATFSKTGEIFTDAPVALGSDFYFPFAPDASNPVGSKLDAFSVDNSESYEGMASIRIDVPNANDPQGNYAGGIFRIDGAGRNLTGFDALTFWAKASQAVTIAQIGFGEDFGENKYRVLKQNLDLTTNWVKYIIPIPDPSKLLEERGMLTYAAAPVGPEGTGLGYTFWIDELKFEKLGTVAQSRPSIFGGEDRVEETFLNARFNASPLRQTFNLASGRNQTVIPTPFYFDFRSSNTGVATVNELGEVSILGTGTAEITATIAGVRAQGSLNVDVLGEFVNADTPPVRNSGDVISIFSDAYTNVNNLNFAIFNDANVQVEEVNFGGNQIVEYNNLTFVGLGWQGTVDVSTMTHLHIDVQVSAGTNPILTVELIDFGPDNADTGSGSDDTGGGFGVLPSDLQEGTWVGIDIPVNAFTRGTGGGFTGSPNLNNIARVVLVSNGSSIIVDNIYFYKE
jgi:hypothetical protein